MSDKGSEHGSERYEGKPRSAHDSRPVPSPFGELLTRCDIVPNRVKYPHTKKLYCLCQTEYKNGILMIQCEGKYQIGRPI